MTSIVVKSTTPPFFGGIGRRNLTGYGVDGVEVREFCTGDLHTLFS
jgi:hypothetical protein